MGNGISDMGCRDMGNGIWDMGKKQYEISRYSIWEGYGLRIWGKDMGIWKDIGCVGVRRAVNDEVGCSEEGYGGVREDVWV